jgi:hypothetical protein
LPTGGDPESKIESGGVRVERIIRIPLALDDGLELPATFRAGSSVAGRDFPVLRHAREPEKPKVVPGRA